MLQTVIMPIDIKINFMLLWYKPYLKNKSRKKKVLKRRIHMIFSPSGLDKLAPRAQPCFHGLQQSKWDGVQQQSSMLHLMMKAKMIETKKWKQKKTNILRICFLILESCLKLWSFFELCTSSSLSMNCSFGSIPLQSYVCSVSFQYFFTNGFVS